MSAGPEADDLVDVHVVGLPLALYRHSAEHHDELRREFALIHQPRLDEGSVPARLQRLADELDSRFGAFTAPTTGVLREALARGDERTDLHYRVPPQAAEAATELATLLDEADAFCREGAHLLTLASPPGPLAFRRWFLGEFVAQVQGAPPTSWEQYVERTGNAS